MLLSAFTPVASKLGTKSALLALIALSTLSYLYYTSTQVHDSLTQAWRSTSQSPQVLLNGTSLLEAQRDCWRSLHTLISYAHPSAQKPKCEGELGGIWYDNTEKMDRPDHIVMPESDVDNMRREHKTFVKGLTGKHAPEAVYNPGTRGVVAAAGGKYLPVLVIGLRMQRRTGSELPVEVFMARSEYEEYACTNILPSLNARCVIFEDILDVVPHTSGQVEHFQYKAIALLFSSFDEVLFTDSDSFPVQNPEILFTTEPFLSHKMIVWPDFWINSASTQYYNISSQKVPPMAQRSSCETGQFVFSKATHAKTLMLALYYNYYGPSHYYELMSQGAYGTGDKETFLHAATSLGEPVWMVKQRPYAIGHNVGFHGFGSAIIQYDPREDYQATEEGERSNSSNSSTIPHPFFLHANYPDRNPATMFEDKGLTLDDDGHNIRMFTDMDTMKEFGFDVEKVFWEEIEWTACELEDKFETWKDKSGICKKVKSYVKDVFGTGKGS